MHMNKSVDHIIAHEQNAIITKMFLHSIDHLAWKLEMTLRLMLLLNWVRCDTF